MRLLFIPLAITAAQDMSAFTCGESTSASEFHFVSPAYPVSVGLANQTCTLSVDHGCQGKSGARPGSAGDAGATCQLRLDFEEFDVQPPLLGTCKFDKFYTSASGNYPLLCGDNTGLHMYLDVEGRASTDLTYVLEELKTELYNCPDKFGVFEAEAETATTAAPTNRQISNPSVSLADPDTLPMLNFPTRRAWKVKVSQVPCGCSSLSVARAPDGCLQNYAGISGGIKGFNYDQVGCFSNDPNCEASQLAACDFYAGYTGQLNNLDYTVCIEQKYGFCGTEYYQALEPGSFSMSNATNLSENFQDSSISGDLHGAGCGADYLLLPGGHCKNDQEHYSTDRFCGNSLGVGGIRQPIISYSRPFLFRVVTDRDEITSSIDYMNRGFHLKYHQLPCSTQK